MKDYLVRGMTIDGFVKAVAIRSTDMVRRAQQIHGTTANATAAFGRALWEQIMRCQKRVLSNQSR